jgi:hypothetical protein
MSDIREFLVQGSDPLPYKVIFKKDGGDLKATCTCKAGSNGILCKHRLSILDGEKGAIISGNENHVEEVASWLSGSKVGAAISEVLALEGQKKLLEAKIKHAKKMIAAALIPNRKKI